MPSPSGWIDLRSDTVTVPTASMRAAMAAADVGDDGYGEDPTVNRLQELAAETLGTEAALFVPSGTMANQLALRVLTQPGTEVLCPARSHVVRYEAGAAPRNAGVQLRGLPDDAGPLDALDVQRALADREHHFPAVSLVTIENTHMPGNGLPSHPEHVVAVAGVAHDAGLPLYCDGARLWNASVALGVTPAALAVSVDAVMCCLSKGLSAPVGSVLCGSQAFIGAALVERKRLGGAMRQAGVIAAAGVLALETMIDRLADDHRRARRLAEMLAETFAGCVDPATVMTNIVCCDARRLPSSLLVRLADNGIRGGTIDATTVRFVTHKDFDDEDLDKVAVVLRRL